MTAAILPFTIVRRHGFVAKQVGHASQMNPESGVRYLHYQMKLQGDARWRRGFDKDLIQRELRCMASAIRTAFVLQTMTDNPGGES